MEADTLTKIDTTAQLNGIGYPDSTLLMLRECNYAGDTTPLVSTKCWLQDSIQLYHQRNSQYYTRHEGVERPNKMMSESLLLILMLLEVLLVAYLIKNGLNFINNSLKGAFSGSQRSDYLGEGSQVGSQMRQYIWILSIVVIALLSPYLMNIYDSRVNPDMDSWMFLRLIIYVSCYFLIKNFLYRILGMVFFNTSKTEQWIVVTKATLSFFALSLTPILIGAETGIPDEANLCDYLGDRIFDSIEDLVTGQGHKHFFSPSRPFFVFHFVSLCP
jgi:hypothetical protein